MKLKITAVIVLSALQLTGCVTARGYFASSVAPSSGTAIVKGITEGVYIRRDDLGIPCVEAKNEEDLFYAVGYSMAQDRLWQMVITKMVMRGRLSEITGPGDLKMDIFIRTLGFDRRVQEALSGLDAKTRMILESFSRGVNAYMAANKKLPPEFKFAGHTPEPWSPEDSLYIFAMFNLNVSFNFLEELNYLIVAQKVGYDKAAWLVPVYPDEELPFSEVRKLAEIPHTELLAMLDGWKGFRERMREILPMNTPASNNWALSGARTKSGRPIVANDTHLILTIPGAWSIMHLKCPGYDAAGVMIPGIPLVSLGYNGNIAWGATMVMADSQDIFIEKMRNDNGKQQYLHKGQWVPVTERIETINSKGGKPVTITVKSTRHGPLLNEALEKMPFPQDFPFQPMPITSKYGLALSWAIEGTGKSLRGIYDLARARNVYEARNAIAKIECIYLNYVFGDRNTIAWQVSGRIPVRKKGRGLTPSPGWNGEYDWTGFIPFEKLPYSISPREGYLVTANNRTVSKNFPLNLTASWYNPERAERLDAILSRMKGATLEDMQKLQADLHSPMAFKIQRMLNSAAMTGEFNNAIESWSDPRKKERAREALSMIGPDRFNAVMTADSPAAVVIGAFEYTLVHELFQDEIGPENSIPWNAFLDMCTMSYSATEDHLVYREGSPFWDSGKYPAQSGKAYVLAESLQKAIIFCEEHMGKDRRKWQWGKLHTYYWRHDVTRKASLLSGLFNRGPYAAGGDVHSINVAGYQWGRDFNVFMIPAMRMIVDFGLEDPAYMISVPGQSGNPSSPHYDDMIPYFLEVKNHPLPFVQSAILRQYKDVLILKPERLK